MLVVLLGAAAASAASAAERPVARAAPEWLAHGVIYQIWLRSFTPEGTLAAAEKRLPAVADLGVNVIYLSPVCYQDPDMRTESWSARQKAAGTHNPRNPYRIFDYNRIDPEYGTEADLKSFIAAAHKLRLRVLIDLVYFHCGPTSPLLDRPGFIVRDAAGKPLLGSWNFPRLNFKSQALREYLWANMAWWIKDFDADGFRCDVGDAVPLDFWTEARRRLQPIRPDIGILCEGEACGDQVAAFDLNYGFSWYNGLSRVLVRGEPASTLRVSWQKMHDERPIGARLMRYTENHDIVNDMFRAEVIYGERGAAAAAVVNFMLDGVPLLYNGQEIGDTSPQSIFGRWPVGWQTACLPRAKAKYAFYQKLCRLRRNESALWSDDVMWLDHDRPDGVLAFLRASGDRRILTVVNLSNRKTEVCIELPKGSPKSYTALLSDVKSAVQTEGRLVLRLDAGGYFVGSNPTKSN